MRQLAGARFIFTLAVLLVVLVPILHAQAVIGTWQGTLPNTESPRVVLRISRKNNAGSLSGSLTFIDRGADGVPLLAVTFNPPELSFAVGDISYRGKLAADARSLDGIGTRGTHTNPLILVLTTPETLWSYAGPAPAPLMSATANPSFEVATIKPSQLGAGNRGLSTRTRQFQARDSTVAELLGFAYQMHDHQLEGGPPWMRELRFDILAEPDAPGLPSLDQQRLMLQKLLAERFGLVTHSVKSVFPVYALTIENQPLKLIPSDVRAHVHASIYLHDGAVGDSAVQFAYQTTPEFADILMNFIQDRQILDETGLTGQFDFTLTMPTSIFHGGEGSDEVGKANAFMTAVRPLGFNLTPKRAPLNVLVIDHLDKPTPN